MEERKLCPLRYYANCVSTTLTVLILHNVESVYFFYSNPVYCIFDDTQPDGPFQIRSLAAEVALMKVCMGNMAVLFAILSVLFMTVTAELFR